MGFWTVRSEFRLEFQEAFRSENGVRFFASLGMIQALAWHVSGKIYSIITSNAGNHAKILGSNLKSRSFTFERHVRFVCTCFAKVFITCQHGLEYDVLRSAFSLSHQWCPQRNSLPLCPLRILASPCCPPQAAAVLRRYELHTRPRAIWSRPLATQSKSCPYPPSANPTLYSG